MGADIVKIESPACDTTRYTGLKRSADMSALYRGLNRSKRSLVLDLKQEAAKDALWRLIDHLNFASLILFGPLFYANRTTSQPDGGNS